MNTRALIAVAAVIAISITAVATIRTVGGETGKKPEPTKTVSIEELSTKRLSHLGKVRVEGVVASKDKGKGLLVLISPKEFKECGTSCKDESTARVLVRWALKIGEKVTVEGTVIEDGKGAAFRANMVKKP